MAGLFALILTPFIVTKPLFFLYITGKAFYFYIITEIVFAVWLVLAIIDPEYRPRKSPLMISFLGILVALFISNIFGVNPMRSFWSNFERMDGYIMIVHVFLYVLVLGSLMKTKKHWSVYLHTNVIASLAMIFIALKQISAEGFSFRIDTTIGNPIYLAAYFLFNSFFTLWLIIQLEKDTFREYIKSTRFWFYVVTWILQVVIIFQTQTRGAALGLAGGILITCALILWRAKDQKAARISSATIIALTLILSGSLYLARNTDFVKHIPFLERLTTISATSGTGQARLWNWSIAWEGIKERPIWGWGQNNYSQIFDTHYNPRMFEQEPWFDRTHNIILEWLVSGGLIGLALYLSIFAGVFWLIWKCLDTSVIEKSFVTGLFSAYLIQNLFVFDHPVSYVLFAMVIAFIYSQTSTECSKLREVSMKGRELWLVFIIVVATPFIVWKLHHEPIAVAQNAVKGMSFFDRNAEGKIIYAHPNGLEDNLKFLRLALEKDTYGSVDIRVKLLDSVESVARVKNIPPEQISQLLSFTEEQLLREIARNPQDARFPYLLSGFYAQFGQMEKAISVLDDAIKIIPNKQQFLFLRARLILSQGKNDEAIKLAKETYEMTPQFDTAWSQYALILSLASADKFKEEINQQISLGNLNRVEDFLASNATRKTATLADYMSLASFYFQINEKDKSVSVIDSALGHFPEANVQLQKLKDEIKKGGNPLGKNF